MDLNIREITLCKKIKVMKFTCKLYFDTLFVGISKRTARYKTIRGTETEKQSTERTTTRYK
jgi:hypothetical protein